MITPSPTDKIQPTQARGTLAQMVEATALKPAYVVMAVPNTSYELHLQPVGGVAAVENAGIEVGKRLIGEIKAQARRIDIVQTGGRYIEPVMGRPRRVQGVVVATDSSTNSVVVNAGVPIRCAITDGRQQASQFEIGQFVSFDVLDGATITVG